MRHLMILPILLFMLSSNIIYSQIKQSDGRKIIPIDEMILLKKKKIKQKRLLENFKKEYSEKDRIVVEEYLRYFKITVDLEGNETSTGGAVCYTINKKTGEKKMAWHEHPMEILKIKEQKNE